MFGGVALIIILAIAFGLAIVVALVVMYFVSRPTIDATEQVPAPINQINNVPQIHHSFSPEQLSHIQNLVAQDQKIEAIKQVREWSGLGLAEAKAIVDAFGNMNLPLSNPNFSTQTQSSYALTAEQTQQLLGLVAQGHKIEAIKHVREWLGFDLAAAKQFVDTLEQGAQVSQTSTTSNATLSAEHILQIRELIKQGHKIEAIKRVRELTGIGLREAKSFVDSLG